MQETVCEPLPFPLAIFVADMVLADALQYLPVVLYRYPRIIIFISFWSCQLSSVVVL